MTKRTLAVREALLTFLTCCAVLLTPTALSAQTEPETPELAAEESQASETAAPDAKVSEPELEERSETRGLEEIVVTTRKASESLQEVPLAITALSEEDIERLNLQDLADLVQQDTSVQFDEGFTPSDTRVTIRGLSPTRGRPNAASLVDGIDLTSEAVNNAGGSTLINPRLIDVQRIEIVKGPQSALFGRSAFAGAIQYVTKDPSDVLEGDLFVSGNNEYDNELRGSVSVPINDELGMLLNGYGWNSQGYYKNIATNDYVGGGDGAGGSATFKWEPTDELGIKWRTEYSRDYYDPAAQVLLNAQNTIVDLGTLTPGASTCNATPNAEGQLLAGPLNDGDCEFRYRMNNGQIVQGPNGEPITQNVTFNLNQFFANPPAGSNLGQFNPNNQANVDQYDKTILSFYQGELPDANGLSVALNPNYREGIGAVNPVDAVDYDGTDSKVFRTAVKLDWAINDELDFLSNSGYLNSTVKIQTDIGKYYVDNCSANIASLFTPYNNTTNINPLPNGASSYADAILTANPDYTQADLARFAPCTLMTPDGINDASNQVTRDDDNHTQQLSQEFRLAWQATATIDLVGGLQYWQERVNLGDITSTTIAGGPECYLLNGQDASQTPGVAAFLQVSGFQDQCGNTNLITAYYMQDTYEGRLANPSDTERETDHYSAYSSLEWNLTEKFTTRLEARYVQEDNSVTGQVVTPCLNGLPYFSANSEFADQSGCDNPPNSPNKNETANGGQATAPSAVILCGQTGRCDRLGLANTPVAQGGSPWYAGNLQAPDGEPPFASSNFDGNSWWAFGYQPAPRNAKELKRTDRYWTPKATLEYFWSDDVMTYASWSQGVKPGGFSLLTSGAFGLDANLDGVYDEIEFDPERLDVWEVGYKTTLADGRVRLNGAFFYQDFKDKQITVQKVTAGTTGAQVENISGSEVRGLEVELTWQATDNWRAQLGYTLLDSEYTDYTIITPAAGDIARINAGNPSETCSELAVIPGSESGNNIGCVMSYNGNQLERAPRNAVLVNLNYTANLLDTGMEWYGETNYRFQDSRYLEASNETEFQAYSLTDVRFGILSDRWDVQLFVTNVFDSDVVTSGGPNPGISTGSFGFGLSSPPFPPGVNAGPKLPSDVFVNMPDPRIVGISGKLRFGG
jgi:outer membrane receptor protein involved in Fe transport